MKKIKLNIQKKAPKPKIQLKKKPKLAIKPKRIRFKNMMEYNEYVEEKYGDKRFQATVFFKPDKANMSKLKGGYGGLRKVKDGYVFKGQPTTNDRVSSTLTSISLPSERKKAEQVRDKSLEWYKTVFHYADADGIEVVFDSEAKVPLSKIAQRYKDNEANDCFFRPILDNIKQRIGKTRDVTMSKYHQFLELKDKFTNGVSDGDIQGIVNFMKLFNVNIYPFESYLMYGLNLPMRLQPKKFVCNNARFTVNLMNSRFNHVELKDNEEDFETVYVEDFSDKQLKIRENLVGYYRTRNGRTNVIVDIANKKIYRAPMLECIRDFDKENGITQLGIRKCEQNKALIAFIDCALHTNNFVNVNFGEKLWNYDHKSSYRQYKKCGFYEGFPTVFNHFSAIDKIMGLGFYRIEELFLPAEIADLGFYHENNVYFSPELKFLESIGARFKITAGAWSEKSIDFDLDFEDKIAYGAWNGTKMVHRVRENIWFNIKDDRIFTHHEGYHKLGEMYFMKNDYEHTNSKVQFPASITAYQRINILRKFLQIGRDKIVFIVNDGFYLNEEWDDGDCDWKLKKVDEEPNHKMSGNYTTNKPYTFPVAKFPYKFNRIYTFTGAGGTGKSHQAFKIWADLAYCIHAKVSYRDNASVNISHNRILGYKCPNYLQKSNNNVHPRVLFVDECSMLSNTQVNKIMEDYPYSTIVFAGDIGSKHPCGSYQVPPLTANACSVRGEVINFSKQYRMKGRLAQIGDELRKFIDQDLSVKEQMAIIKRYCREFKYTHEAKGEVIAGCKKHGTTVHSYQSKTVDGDITLIIDYESFAYHDAKYLLQIFYTGLSRARSIENVYWSYKVHSPLQAEHSSK